MFPLYSNKYHIFFSVHERIIFWNSNKWSYLRIQQKKLSFIPIRLSTLQKFSLSSIREFFSIIDHTRIQNFIICKCTKLHIYIYINIETFILYTAYTNRKIFRASILFLISIVVFYDVPRQILNTAISINIWHIKFATKYSASSDSYKKWYINTNQIIDERVWYEIFHFSFSNFFKLLLAEIWKNKNKSLKMW